MNKKFLAMLLIAAFAVVSVGTAAAMTPPTEKNGGKLTRIQKEKKNAACKLQYKNALSTGTKNYNASMKRANEAYKLATQTAKTTRQAEIKSAGTNKTAIKAAKNKYKVAIKAAQKVKKETQKTALKTRTQSKKSLGSQLKTCKAAI